MIAYLKGTIAQLEPTYAVIDVHGVGYYLHISLQTYAECKGKKDVFLHTHLNVREDAHVLFGFSTLVEKRIFQLLISVNGVGPGTAIVMLSYLTVDEMRNAILQEDATILQRVKGVGLKTAQRVIIELKDKIRKEAAGLAAIPGAQHNTQRDEALSALTTLGITRTLAEKSVDAVLKKSGNTITLEELVKQALKNN